MKHLLIVFILGLLLGLGLSYFLTSLNKTTLHHTTTHSDVLDAHFIEQMIPHHEDAILMSTVILNRTDNAEIKQLAMRIIDDQTHEIQAMQLDYKKWFGRELPSSNETMQHHATGSGTGLHMGVYGTAEDMSRLEDAVDVDTVFLESMITHHQMAVMMASLVKDGTTRPEMKRLSDSIITVQTSEIEQMRQLLTKKTITPLP